MSAPLRFKAVVPARFASTRLPGKPLLDLGGKPMVVRVAERAALSGAEEVWIATDHADVFAAAQQHGHSVLLTRADHPTGTDRLAEVVEQRGWDDETIIVNVQGDEPLIDPDLVAQTAQQLADSGADIATVAHPISDPADFFAPNVVKVVTDSPAAKAGMTAGSTLIKVGDTTVRAGMNLANVIRSLEPGQQVSISWITTSGKTRTATVTLGSSPVN